MPFIHTLDTFFAIVSNDEQLFISIKDNNGQRYNIIFMDCYFRYLCVCKIILLIAFY